jgi:hypothetical protein
VRDGQIDEVLARAGRTPHAVSAELLQRIAASIEPSLQPVRRLPPSWMLAGGLVLIAALVALLGAARAGLQGFDALSPGARAAIFTTLAVLAGAAASQVVTEWIPGSRRRLNSGALVAIVSVALLVDFSLLFHDHRTVHFVSVGLSCLTTGLLLAAPVALLGWWWLRRAWAVNSVAAGVALGVLAGLAGVTMLELHCTNFELLHILVWHTLVVPISGAVGATVGWALRRHSG